MGNIALRVRCLSGDVIDNGSMHRLLINMGNSSIDENAGLYQSDNDVKFTVSPHLVEVQDSLGNYLFVPTLSSMMYGWGWRKVAVSGDTAIVMKFASNAKGLDVIEDSEELPASPSQAVDPKTTTASIPSFDADLHIELGGTNVSEALGAFEEDHIFEEPPATPAAIEQFHAMDIPSLEIAPERYEHRPTALKTSPQWQSCEGSLMVEKEPELIAAQNALKSYFERLGLTTSFSHSRAKVVICDGQVSFFSMELCPD